MESICGARGCGHGMRAIEANVERAARAESEGREEGDISEVSLAEVRTYLVSPRVSSK
jgi:hypothetical protein